MRKNDLTPFVGQSVTVVFKNAETQIGALIDFEDGYFQVGKFGGYFTPAVVLSVTPFTKVTRKPAAKKAPAGATKATPRKPAVANKRPPAAKKVAAAAANGKRKK